MKRMVSAVVAGLRKLLKPFIAAKTQRNSSDSEPRTMTTIFLWLVLVPIANCPPISDMIIGGGLAGSRNPRRVRATGALVYHPSSGRVAEWLMAPVLKTGVPERVSGVRIPPLPPFL